MTSMQAPSESHRTVDANISRKAKTAAREMDPNEGRCLVQNFPMVVDCCHCIPRNTKNNHQILESLEWAWNMEHRTLDIDSPYNLFWANPYFHRSFDQNEWLLMPEDHILKLYSPSLSTIQGHSYAKRKLFPESTEGTIFSYKLVPLKNLETVGIAHQHSIPTDDTPLSDAHVSLHFHPFDTLPLLRSHLQPQFVIFNAGAKLALLRYETVEWISQHYTGILWMLTLYKAWISPLEITLKDDPSFRYNEKDDDNHDDDDDSDYSERPKSRKSVGKKRKAQSKTESHSRKRNAAGSTRMVLSKGSLSSHNLSTHNQLLGEAGQTDDGIHKWSLQQRRLAKILAKSLAKRSACRSNLIQASFLYPSSSQTLVD